MAQILLTHSYLLAFDPKQRKLGRPYAPLGTLYAAAVLKKQGFDLVFHDMMFASQPGELASLLDLHKPGLVVIYDDGFNYLNKMCLTNMRKAALEMTGLAKARGVKVVVCSSDASDQYSLYLREGADFVIRGEGEITLARLTTRLLSGNPDAYADISGIAWKSSDGIFTNTPRPVITALDELPFPAWELLDMERYRRTWKRKNGYFILNMVTTRGCPYQCVWCAKPIYGNHYNSRSPGNVIQEMVFLKKNYSPDGIWFADDIFGLTPGWVAEFDTQLRSRSIFIPYTIQTRVDLLLDTHEVRSLAGSGCRKAWLGIESGSQKILDAMKKGTTVEQARTVSPLLREAGIEQAFFLQLGFPGETKDDIRDTVRLLTDLLPDDIGISVTYPLPGTKFYGEVRNQLRGKTYWTDSDDLELMFESNFQPSYYKYLHRYIHKYFRFRQGIHYLTELFSHASALNRARARRILLIPYYGLFALAFKIVLNQLQEADRNGV